MRGCNCQGHQPYQSIYCMLNLNETASETELKHAYKEELSRLDQLQPESESEQVLLDNKRQELNRAMEKAKEETLSQRIQNQYQKRKDHSVRLYSFAPVGFIGLILRLLNKVFGAGGWVDSILFGAVDACDTNFCDCFGCGDCCECCGYIDYPGDRFCFGNLYECICSDGLCKGPTVCVTCYENVYIVRLIDMGVAVIVAIGAVLCFIKRSAQAAADRAKRKKNFDKAIDDLWELKDMLQQRDDLVSRFIDYRNSLSDFSLDIRPFAKFIAALPGATKKFIEMTNHLNQPGSFYDEVQEEFRKMEELHKQITMVDQRVIRLAERLQANEMHHELENHEPCNEYLDQALNGLRKNYKYQVAVDFLKRNT